MAWNDLLDYYMTMKYYVVLQLAYLSKKNRAVAIENRFERLILLDVITQIFRKIRFFRNKFMKFVEIVIFELSYLITNYSKT